MTRRPNPFDQAQLEQALLDLGCPESFVSTAVSNYRLFVPLVLAELGEDRVYDLINSARYDLGLGEQESAWRSSVKYIVAWARATITYYKVRRGNALVLAPPIEETQQPRLL